MVPAAMGLPAGGSHLDQDSGFAYRSNRYNGRDMGPRVLPGTPTGVKTQRHETPLVTGLMGVMVPTCSGQASRQGLGSLNTNVFKSYH